MENKQFSKKLFYKHLLTVICFIIGFFYIFSDISEVLRPKQGDGNADLIHSFYTIDKNTLDVIVLGSSISYYGIQPNVLWHEYGITSCDLSSPSQSIPTSYYLLLEALRFQHPKVVVLESYAIWNDQKYYTKERLHAASDPMKMGIPKLKMLKDMTEDMSFSEKSEFYLPFLMYHNRWNQLNENDFVAPSYLKGSQISTKIHPNEEVIVPHTYAEIPSIVTEYFEKIVNVCAENNIELFVVQVPVGRYKGDDWPTFTDDMLSIANSFYDYLDNKGIQNKFYQRDGDIPLNWEKDFSDNTHLNSKGAEKTTKKLGEYLDNLYNLPDHRDEKKYEKWDEDYEKYLLDLAEMNDQ